MGGYVTLAGETYLASVEGRATPLDTALNYYGLYHPATGDLWGYYVEGLYGSPFGH
jgi:hypothetical protein